MDRKCTLSVLFASEAERAVIFRRGPSKQTCMIAWDMRKDRFDVGQWFKGHVYLGHSDLSPDGKWLIASLGNFRPPLRTWIALSEPPYFTARALWPATGTWFGYPEFLSKDVLYLPDGYAIAPNFSVPSCLTVIGKDGPFPDPKGRAAPRKAPAKSPPSPGVRYDHDSGKAGIQGKNGFIPIVGAEWLKVDDGGDILFSIGGRLYRLSAGKAAKARSEEDVLRYARLLADFTDLAFRPLAAPGRTRRK